MARAESNVYGVLLSKGRRASCIDVFVLFKPSGVGLSIDRRTFCTEMLVLFNPAGVVMRPELSLFACVNEFSEKRLGQPLLRNEFGAVTEFVVLEHPSPRGSSKFASSRRPPRAFRDLGVDSVADACTGK